MSSVVKILLLLLLSAMAGNGCDTLTEPEQNTVYVSTRNVTCLYIAANGDVWAGTTGGLLRCDAASGNWQHFTRVHGLPAHEIQEIGEQEIREADGAIVVRFPTKTARWNGTDWTPLTREKPRFAPGFTVRPNAIDGMGQLLTLPPQTIGTHFTAACAVPGGLVAAVYGDPALYQWNGEKWLPQPIALPDDAARSITALAQTPQGTLYIGTRRHGLFHIQGNRAEPIAAFGAGPVDHNIQALCLFQGRLYASTLEDGLQVFTNPRKTEFSEGWSQYANGTLSGNAPRQMAVFQNALYVRQGNHKVDRFDGKQWTRDVFSSVLPRKQMSSLATNGGRLFVAQWGGWSVWDGRNWQHHFAEPSLLGAAPTTLCPDPDGATLWLGIQGKGLAEIEIRTGAVRRWYNEHNGLSDDWVTELYCLPTVGGVRRVYAGTFVGGLYTLQASGKWQVVPGTEGENITGLTTKGDVLYVLTRRGLRAVSLNPDVAPPALPPLVSDPTVEGQCIYPGKTGLYIGTRTALYFLPTVQERDRTLRRRK